MYNINNNMMRLYEVRACMYSINNNMMRLYEVRGLYEAV